MDSRYAEHVLIGLSFLLPVGEDYMVSIMRCYVDSIDDAELKRRVAQFIQEEENHRDAHNKCNNRAFSSYAERVDPILAPHIKRRNTRADKQHRHLSYVAGIEYFATSLSRHVLRNHEVWFADLPAQARKIFLYHCKEELGHKDVVFDMLRYVNVEKAQECKYCYLALKNFMLFMLLSVYKTGGVRLSLYGVYFWAKNAWPIMRDVVKHLKQDYHPNHTDDSHLINLTLQKSA